MAKRHSIEVEFCQTLKRDPFMVAGRDAWALKELMVAGETGCTPIDNPAPRWSAYVFKLRQAGFDIETIHESHRGAYPGTHARYILRSRVRVVSDTDAMVPA